MKAMANEGKYCASYVTDNALEEKSPQIRKAAVEAMGLMDGHWAGNTVTALLNLLVSEKYKDVWGEATAALASVAAGENRSWEGGLMENDIVERLPKLPPEAKVAVYNLLVNRKGYLGLVLKAAGEEKDEAVRAAAIRAVGTLGGKEQAPTVIGWVSGAGGDALRQAAEEALVRLGRGGAGDAVAAATADAAAKASGPAVFRAYGYIK
jgi:HEAT repeat protein